MVTFSYCGTDGRKVKSRPDPISLWLTFFLRALHTQMQRLAAKMERERLLQHALPDLSRRIVEHAREHGRVTIKEMTLLTGTSRNTLKEHFQRLLENGMLERNGQGRGVWYRVK